MDRFKELRETLSRISGGINIGGVAGSWIDGSSGGSSSGGFESYGARDANEILDQLPLTREFIEQGPRQRVVEAARVNDEKAAEALQLINRVDEVVTSHTTIAATLSTCLSTIGTLKQDIETAESLANTLHHRLLTLDSLVSATEQRLAQEEAKLLQDAEDERFERFAREKRAGLARKREEYRGELERFRRERVMVLEGEGGGYGGVGAGTGAEGDGGISSNIFPSLDSISSFLPFQGSIQRPPHPLSPTHIPTHARKGSKSSSNNNIGLEEELLLHGDEEFERDRMGLEGFLGGEDGGDESSKLESKEEKREEEEEEEKQIKRINKELLLPHTKLISPPPPVTAATAISFPSADTDLPINKPTLSSPSPSEQPDVPVPTIATKLPPPSPSPVLSPQPPPPQPKKKPPPQKNSIPKRANNLVIIEDEDLDPELDDVGSYGGGGKKGKGKKKTGRIK